MVIVLTLALIPSKTEPFRQRELVLRKQIAIDVGQRPAIEIGPVRDRPIGQERRDQPFELDSSVRVVRVRNGS